ncbi:MAG TPA: hypothetical protein VFR09_03750 [Alphaproteobacteria bacterium]|nr:hypothetical protein [Alphaproteobacteria bacterium]
MNMSMTRRSVLAALASAVPALAMTKTAKALTAVSAADAHFPSATGLWKVLEHVTDGSDPSTALPAPPAPKFTSEIQALAGKQIELSGYLTPLSGGFGKKQDYLLSRENFHCPYCYAFGRGSLALVSFDGHVPPSTGKVTIKATLALQSADPSDFYFQLKSARVA